MVRDRVRLHEDVLRQTFDKFDKDKSGSITAADLQEIIDDFDDDDVQELVESISPSGLQDGKIAYEDFVEYFIKQDKQERLAKVIDDWYKAGDLGLLQSKKAENHGKCFSALAS